jgi:hypothetical protein
MAFGLGVFESRMLALTLLLIWLPGMFAIVSRETGFQTVYSHAACSIRMKPGRLAQGESTAIDVNVWCPQRVEVTEVEIQPSDGADVFRYDTGDVLPGGWVVSPSVHNYAHVRFHYTPDDRVVDDEVRFVLHYQTRIPCSPAPPDNIFPFREAAGDAR